MDRRVRTPIRAALLAAVGAAGLLLAACSNVNLVQLLTTEVMRATNKFLVVQGVKNPTAQTNVNPGIQFRIDFDRPLDPATVLAANVTLTGPGSYTLKVEVGGSANIILVKANPYLSDMQSYTLTIPEGGIKSSMGEALENDFSWTFTTGTFPAGIVTVTDGGGTDIDYTGAMTNYLTIERNGVAQQYRIGHAATDYGSFSESDTTGWTNVTTAKFTVTDPKGDLAAGDGEKTVYIQFADSLLEKFSLVMSDTVILDRTPPSAPTVSQYISPIGTYTNTVYVNSVYSAGGGATNATASAADTGCGVGSYIWNTVAGVSITPSSAATPTIQVTSGDGSYSVSVAAVDKVGNTSSTTPVTVICDTSAPAAPSFTALDTPLYTVDGDPRVTVWNWSSGGGAGKYGLDLYQYQPRDLKWTKVSSTSGTTATDSVQFAAKFLDSVRLRAFADGDYVLRLREYDASGNISAYAAGSCTIAPPGAGWRIMLGKAAPSTTDMPVPSKASKPSPKFEWRAMSGATSYTLYYRVNGITTWTSVSRTTTYYDTGLSPGTSYEWYVKGNTGEVNPDSRADGVKYWPFLTQ